MWLFEAYLKREESSNYHLRPRIPTFHVDPTLLKPCLSYQAASKRPLQSLALRDLTPQFVQRIAKASLYMPLKFLPLARRKSLHDLEKKQSLQLLITWMSTPLLVTPNSF